MISPRPGLRANRARSSRSTRFSRQRNDHGCRDGADLVLKLDDIERIERMIAMVEAAGTSFCAKSRQPGDAESNAASGGSAG